MAMLCYHSLMSQLSQLTVRTQIYHTSVFMQGHVKKGLLNHTNIPCRMSLNKEIRIKKLGAMAFVLRTIPGYILNSARIYEILYFAFYPFISYL